MPEENAARINVRCFIMEQIPAQICSASYIALAFGVTFGVNYGVILELTFGLTFGITFGATFA